ncbi:hypothetical protein VTI28DRAFT_7254 [Corynascus sepedonium]
MQSTGQRPIRCLGGAVDRRQGHAASRLGVQRMADRQGTLHPGSHRAARNRAVVKIMGVQEEIDRRHASHHHSKDVIWRLLPAAQVQFRWWCLPARSHVNHGPSQDGGTCLITTTALVVVFGTILAWRMEKPAYVLAATLAYTAVLVVYLGLAAEGDGSVQTSPT